MEPMPHLDTGVRCLDDAFRIAVGDLVGNVVPFRDGLLERPELCIMAGMHYRTPWTRDAAFNAWYGAGLAIPDAARHTLLSVLTRDGGSVRIGGQYWDAVIWTTGAWHYYLYTGDRDFLALALEASRNSLRFFEDTELDPADGLFRGGACYQDGMAYPDAFTEPKFFGGILRWAELNPDKRVPRGEGLPIKALSTNCLYFNAYRLVGEMGRELGEPQDGSWDARAQSLRAAIDRRFWNEATGHYRYLVDAGDDDCRQEGLGHAFALLFGVADERQARSVLERQHITPHGIACNWPQYPRYETPGGTTFGRHSGTVWPQVNAAWAVAAARGGRRDLALAEIRGLAEKALRDAQFTEIYHPLTGQKYGGLQEDRQAQAIVETVSRDRQTWCATGYMFMVLSVLFGIRFTARGVGFDPCLPEGCERMRLRSLRYRNARLDVTVRRSARPGFAVDGAGRPEAFLAADASGDVSVEIGVAGG